MASLAAAFPKFVYDGTMQQQLTCKFAVHLGLKKFIPPSMLRITGALIEAMYIVLVVGAPATRDIAVEGLGALLKHPLAQSIEIPVAGPSKEQQGEGNTELNDEYARLSRRQRHMVFAVAGREPARGQFLALLEKTERDIDLRGKKIDVRAMEEHADRLRTLPALYRQTPEEMQEETLERCITILCNSARATIIEPADSSIDVARFRESIFRTIDKMIDRGAAATRFDAVVAMALKATPRTLIGQPFDCNANVRATVAIMMTAAKLVKHSSISTTETELRSLFKVLSAPQSLWTNPGIVEGCFRTLPILLANPKYAGDMEGALGTLFHELKQTPAADDFPGIHRRIYATSCFRLLLTAVTEHIYAQIRQLRSGERLELDVDRAVHALVATVAPKLIEHVFEPEFDLVSGFGDAPAASRSETVMAAAAFEDELLAERPHCTGNGARPRRRRGSC